MNHVESILRNKFGVTFFELKPTLSTYYID